MASICEDKNLTMNFLQGTLDVLVLKTLSWGPRHGYAVSRWIAETTDDALSVEEGALYTSLHRMEKRGWLEAEWRTSPKGRRAKYYSLTATGRRQLRAAERNWNQFSAAVAKVFAARSPWTNSTPNWTFISLKPSTGSSRRAGRRSTRTLR